MAVAKRLLFFLLLAIAFSGCSPLGLAPLPSSTATMMATRSQSPPPLIPPTTTPSPPPTPSPSPWPAPTATPEPAGCLRPPDDYTPLQVNGWRLNRRTFEMLQQAATLYPGELEISGYAITQGSYHDNGAASFGTHLGGGAIDLSVMRKDTYTILYDDIEPLVHALRLAGFAAWFRDFDEVYFGSPVHIHAIAIGDEQLSQAAQDQLTGPYGYFRGYTGIPQANGIPLADRHGGPVLCQWMRDLGYTDLRTPPAP